MKRTLLLLSTSLCVSSIAYSQEKIDTLYYDKSGRAAQNNIFADYYKVSLYPADSTKHKEFKDFYISGELRKEGYFKLVDSLDDNQTIFEGEVISFFKNGNVSERAHYSSGKLEGEYLRYGLDGSLEVEANYSEDKLSGIHKTYNEYGSCRIIEYQAGEPLYDYYILSDMNGNTLKYHISDDSPIWESPAIHERFVDYRDGVPWQVYFKNGITIALTNSTVKDYGKWHRIDIIISNNTLTPIEFTPEINIEAYSVNAQEIISDLDVWSYEAYMKKVRQAQAWAAVAVGFSEGMATANAGYSTSTTTGYNSYGGYSTYTTTTYNASNAYYANMASQQRIADFSQALQDEKDIKQLGYLKKNTIYPSESVSGFVHVKRLKGTRVVFIINIEGAEYIYDWNFGRK